MYAAPRRSNMRVCKRKPNRTWSNLHMLQYCIVATGREAKRHMNKTLIRKKASFPSKARRCLVENRYISRRTSAGFKWPGQRHRLVLEGDRQGSAPQRARPQYYSVLYTPYREQYSPS